MKTVYAIIAAAVLSLCGCDGRQELPAGYVQDTQGTKRIMVRDALTMADKKIVEIIAIRVLPPGAQFPLDPKSSTGQARLWASICSNWLADEERHAPLVKTKRTMDDWYNEHKRLANTEIALVVRVLIAIEARHPDQAMVMSRESLASLATDIGKYANEYPDNYIASHNGDYVIVAAELGRSNGLYHSSLSGPAEVKYAHQTFEIRQPLQAFEPLVRAWQQRRGSPYVGVGDIVARIWSLNSFLVGQEERNKYITNTSEAIRKDVNNDNRYAYFVVQGGDIMASAFRTE